jgi:beta-1,4-N-acetylglucosaminyltransferase
MTDVLVVCSPGGHFSEARELVEGLQSVDYKFVIHLAPAIPESMKDRIIVAPHAERDPRLILQFFFALRCLWQERPKIIITTGAAIAVPFGLAAKLYGIKLIYIESPTRVNTPSLSARLCYRFADVLYVRHRALLKFFPNASYFESV